MNDNNNCDGAGASPARNTVFSKDEKRILFTIARESILKALKGDREDAFHNIPDLSENLTTPMGAFVTLSIDNRLRGCVGRVVTIDPLYKVIAEMARSAAFDDSRFHPLTDKEYNSINIEISVLTPIKKIDSINEIVIGKHGLLIIKGNYSGLLLPEVASDRDWTVKQFLEVTSEEKAGIGKDGWKSADIYIFESVLLVENELT